MLLGLVADSIILKQWGAQAMMGPAGGTAAFFNEICPKMPEQNRGAIEWSGCTCALEMSREVYLQIYLSNMVKIK